MNFASITAKVLGSVAAVLLCLGLPAGAFGSDEASDDSPAEGLHAAGPAAADAESPRDEQEIDFNIGAALRDPFWPVGYTPQADIKPEEAAVVTTGDQRRRAQAKLRFGGTITLGDKFLATVNGQLVEEGDIISVTVDGVRFRFQVHGISMKGVRFKPVD